MQLFHFWSCDVHPVQNLLLCTKWHQNHMIFHWDKVIDRFSKWRLSAILELFYHHTKSLLLAAAACQISCQSDTQIWRYSYLNFSHICLEIQAPKMGVLGDFGPLNVYNHHRDPQKAHPCVNPRLFKQSTVKNSLRGLTCRRVDRKCDGHTQRRTHTHTQVNLYSVHAQHWTDNNLCA